MAHTHKTQGGVEISRKNAVGLLVTGTLTPLVSPPNTSTQLVLKPTATNSGRHFWSRGASGGRADGFVWGTAWGAYSPATGIFSGGTVNTNAHLVIITFATAAEIVVDGTQVATDSGSASLSGHTLASEPGGGNPWAGYIAFAGLYNGTLTSGQKADLLAWAQDHYGV